MPPLVPGLGEAVDKEDRIAGPPDNIVHPNAVHIGPVMIEPSIAFLSSTSVVAYSPHSFMPL
jgi:hypothetical protein